MLEQNERTWQEQARVDRMLHMARNADEYRSILPELSGDELQEELESVQSELALLRRCVRNNEMNGYGSSEMTQSQRRDVANQEQKIAFIQEEQARRSED